MIWVAAEGILLPLAGRYIVRWGLLDPKTGVWYAPPETVRTVVDVKDFEDAEDAVVAQVFTVPVDGPTLQQARRGLADQVRAMTSGR